MSKNTAQVTVNVINKAQTTNLPPTGVAYVIGPTERGIPNDPSALVTSVAQFERLFGGVQAGNDFPLMCEQAIQGGATLRVCKVVGAGATPSVANLTWDGSGGSQALMLLNSKGVGTYYEDVNKFNADTLPPSDGLSGHFNLMITDVDAGITEIFENLVPTAGAANTQTWAKEIIDTSRLVDVVYENTTGLSGAVTPQADIGFSLGSPGAALTLTEYTGSPTDVDGFYAFDPYDDGNMISTLSRDDAELSGIYGVGKAYAILRKDLIYVEEMDYATMGQTAIKTALDSITTQGTTKWAMYVYGGIKVPDKLNGGTKLMKGLGMVLGAIALSQNAYGPWYSPTGFIRGNLPAATGVVNNFGSPASLADRNILANASGSGIVLKSNTIMLWDAYTMALSNSPEKFFSVVQLEIYMMNVLKPALEQFLGDPNTFTTWERIYYTVLPFLESLVNNEAIYEYKWDGDQFATSLDNLVINDPTEVGQGIYKIQLQIKVVVPIVEITLNIILTENSVEFA